MSSTVPRKLVETSYEAYAQEYLRSLPLEHFMESTAQARQRAITVASLQLVEARRPDFHLCNELLVQYPRKRGRRPGQVVPDNMVVVSEQPLHAESSFNLPLEPAPPFWVMEYVSTASKRKDYEESFRKYEEELRVPYYLLFYPETQDLTLYHHDGTRYVLVKTNEQGRHALPEVEIEVGLLDGWVRYWYQGELLPLPAELLKQVEHERQRAERAEAEVARLRAQLRQRGGPGE